MAENTEFNIEGRNESFRFAYISPVELLALSTQLDLENFEKTVVVFKFAVEHIEVLMGDKWVPVKTKNKEVYMPFGIDKDMNALDALCTHFIEEVMGPAFQKSSE